MPKLLRHLLKLVGVLAIVAWSLVPIGLIAMSSFKADRDIFSISLTNRSKPGPKPLVQHIAGEHAREIANPELLMAFANQILAGYGVARIVAEFFREPDAQLGFLWGGATMGQLLSLPMIAVGIGAILYARRRKPA